MSEHITEYGSKKDYVCPNWGGLHDYSDTIADTDHVIVERCIRCGHKIMFIKKEGRIDNKRYGETHKLWFLQTTNPLFQKYYPEANLKPLPPKNKYAKMCLEEKQYHYAEEINQGMKENRREVLHSAPRT